MRLLCLLPLSVALAFLGAVPSAGAAPARSPAAAVQADAASMDEATAASTLGTAFPNPATGAEVVIPFEVAEVGAVRVAVYDNLGRRVASVASREAPAGTHTVALDLGAVPAGVYLVRVTAETDGGPAVVWTRRVVVAR